ncbi:hypothetical protein ACFT4A_10100 [Streptomyces sp. NPDC057099]|uniref:hypothetical protein n=1 Tax=Streptomyces sp. NPDC057099 TaxID=3346019 RepID=UPI0036259021
MKWKSLGTALTTAALIGTALTGAVATAGTAASATKPDCGSALTNVKPKSSATALGTWGKGQKGGVCFGGPNGTSKEGWVPATCLPI